MSEVKTYPILRDFAKHANVDEAKYHEWYAQSVNEPDAFWAEQAERLQWHKRWDRVKHTDYEKVDIRWFEGGMLNVCENCVDRHLEARGDKVAIIWEGDDGKDQRLITYRELHKEVCKTANMLTSLGVKPKDRVTIYMPMIPEAAFAMLACARIGAIHSVVFGGFSPEALKGRIIDAESHFVITADEGVRGGRHVPLKANVDKACEGMAEMKVLVVRRTGGETGWQDGRDIWWHEAIAEQPEAAPIVAFDAEHPLFILYTSGSTGKPKGLLHTSAGYLLYAALTHYMVFDIKEEDVYWCTADVGWITGHSYILYGPLANGATTLMFEGVPSYPDASRFWQVVDKYKVSIFYTAPTAIRALRSAGDEWVKKTSRSSLRLLGSVGEPINPEAWRWYYEVVGDSRCPIVDTWWQTETGGIMISPLPGAVALKPGSATKPLPGVQPVLLNVGGNEVEGAGEGALCVKDSWPGQARTLYGDHNRYIETYFTAFHEYYFTGDAASRDADGYFWITGRMDDVLNVSGHRLGTAEIESALVAHPDVAEAAVVGYPHEIKGEGIYVYVTLNPSVNVTGDAANDEISTLKQWVRTEIGPIATPDVIRFASGLPKTRSGKIMRRILRKIAHNDTDNLGDTSTLVNPEVVDELLSSA